MKTHIFPLLLTCLLAGPSHGDIQWEKNWDSAIAAAKKDGAIVMADVYTDWCRWCKVLDQQTFSNAQVQKDLDGIIAVKINAEAAPDSAVARRFGVRSYPTVLFVDADGFEIDRLNGFLPPAAFRNRLAGVREGSTTLRAYLGRIAADSTDVEAWKCAGDKYRERSDWDKAGDCYDAALRLDPTDSQGVAASAHLSRGRIALAARNNEAAARELEQVIDLGNDAAATREAYPALRRLYTQSSRDEDIDRVHDRVVSMISQDPQVLNDIAWYYASRSTRLDDALQWATKGVSLAPGDASIMDTLAEVHHRRGEHAEAIRVIREAIQIDPTSEYYRKQLERFQKAAENTAS